MKNAPYMMTTKKPTHLFQATQQLNYIIGTGALRDTLVKQVQEDLVHCT